MSRPHGRARVDPRSPRAFAVCERCGMWYNHYALRWQVDYRGTKLQNLRKLVCDRCYDDPQPQLKPRIIGPDPLPIMNARPETAVTVTTTVSANYSFLPTDQLVSCTGSSNFTVTLPTAVTTPDTFTWPVAVGDAGKTVTVQNNGTGIITIATVLGQTINDIPLFVVWGEGNNLEWGTGNNLEWGLVDSSPYTLNPGEEAAFVSDGANWETIPA